MKNTQFKVKKSKFVDSRGLNIKRNYSSFWMDDKWDTNSKFSGMPVNTGSTNIIKLVKLSNYRRAIVNFVKIVAKQDIPVTWAGNTSYTDGKSVTLSTDIKDSNFDVTVGLALHEASHIVLSDFKLIKELNEGTNELFNNFINEQSVGDYSEWKAITFNLLNWIEDRRIDNFVFSTSPGYKAYYHKLYDYYWNSDQVHKGFASKEYSDATNIDNWFFHIINCLNPQFNPKALPRLDEVVGLVNVRNISRLQSTGEALQVALEMVKIIHTEVTLAQADNKTNPGDGGADVNEDSGNGVSSNNVGDPNQDGQSGNGVGEGEGGDVEKEGDNENQLTPQEIRDIKNAFQKQKNFLSGQYNKKRATNKLQRDLDSVAKQAIELQTVGGNDGVKTRTSLIYDLTNPHTVGNYYELGKSIKAKRELMDKLKYGTKEYERLSKEVDVMREAIKATGLDEVLSLYDSYAEEFKKGLEMGGLLGKKLQLHNESRERVDNRLRSGKIDNKRLASAGYGIESVFKQIHVDKYKKANLHISLDGSGSMGGSKWESVVQMATAICKAAKYTQNINVQVSIRVTTGNDVPTILSAYDSRKNSINHLESVFNTFSPSSMTPEGLCFEAMVRKNMLVPSSSEIDSYFLNLSDGEPSCSDYHGYQAVRHTKSWVNKIKANYNISVLSFWLESSRNEDKDATDAELLQRYQNLLVKFDSSHSAKQFRDMYGSDASVVDSSSAVMIAKALNKKFLTQ